MKKSIFFLIVCFLTIASPFISSAQFSKLIDFAGAANGSRPYGNFIYDGTFLYGMTSEGGTNNLGVIFKIKPDGTGFAKLRDFAAAPDGANPNADLMNDGTSLYGMTLNGGANTFGTIFKIQPDGTGYSKLYDFTGGIAGGQAPTGNLISVGAFLYGMTWLGGTSDMGIIFKIQPNGTGFAKVYDFVGGAASGRGPYGSLMYDGTFFYGMTRWGGVNDLGTIFKIKPDGTGYTILLHFDGAANGNRPYGNLIYDGTFLYGMTRIGGSSSYGVIFKIKPDGTGYVKLHDFTGNPDGRYPWGDLIYDGSTFLYGMTQSGGINNLGTIFQIKPDGTGYSKLVDLNGAANGSSPYGSLIYDGTCFIGMTRSGGTSNLGIAFSCFDLLPVELISFTGSCDDMQTNLLWATASETNSDFFSIERRLDGGIFEEVGKIKGAGNSSTTRAYEFTDIEPSATTLPPAFFYRLKQVDYNGNYEYYGPLSVLCTPTDEWNLILQNTPATDELLGTLVLPEYQKLQTEINDLQGRTILLPLGKAGIAFSKGANHLKIDLKNISNGVYFLKVYNDKKQLTKKFMKY